MKYESTNSPEGNSREAESSAPAARKDETAEPPGFPSLAEEQLTVPIAGEALPDQPGLADRLKLLLVGKPRDLSDRSIFHSLSLVAFLAWVGLGADGLSSSCYGPAEAFADLKEFRFLAIFLALAIAVTVLVISACYSHLIEEFPSGGGGYLVASKLLGPRIGAVAGCALLVDYVLTITVSIAAAGDALFGLIGPEWHYVFSEHLDLKLSAEFAAIIGLVVLNLRGVKESVQVLMPIFLLFLFTHAVLIFGAIGMHLPAMPELARGVVSETRAGLNDPAIGLGVMLFALLHAYSLSAGTYTGIEAVSNSMQVMREPRVATAKRTMLYMSLSLAITAGGLIVAYLLLNIPHVEGKTMNHVLTERFLGEIGLGGGWLGGGILIATLLSEGALLLVAAQAGFIGGPRGLANMAQDSWIPRWFANLSERLATENGILLMGVFALAALWQSKGNVSMLLVMYSINVFVTFSLSMIGMCRHWYRQRGQNPLWRRRLALFFTGAVLCLAILAVTVRFKFTEGAWETIVVTGTFVVLCLLTRRYYNRVGLRVKRLDETLGHLPSTGEPNLAEPDPIQPAAVILVGGYSGLGIHTLLNAIRFAPGYYRSLVFISVGVVDTGNFKGASAVEELRAQGEDSLRRYVELAQRLGLPATSLYAIGTDAVDELEQLCLEAAKKFTKATFFAGQLVFQKDTWLHRLLHNQTAVSLQRRLQWAGLPMVILPTRVR